jgi:ELP3 family radical SAM enzyme/protein acetyltransferase
VQLGIQHTDDAILTKINRDCSTATTIKALELLRNCCYKMDIHLMPNLPGSTVELDRKMFNRILDSPDLHADQWKIYPCEVVPWTVIKKWFESGEYVPYSAAALEELLIGVKAKMHPWIRLNRVIRDIPAQYVSGENDAPNLRQELAIKMAKRGLYCKCIRCREVRGDRKKLGVPQLVHRQYRAGQGAEHFVSFETDDRKRIHGFVRVRICDDPNLAGGGVFPELVGCALVRELHVYGKLMTTYTEDANQNQPKEDVQHYGLGTRLMLEAEAIAVKHGYTKLAVIAGVGVRGFYRKLGYVTDPDSEMMIKHLKAPMHATLRVVAVRFIIILMAAIVIQNLLDYIP